MLGIAQGQDPRGPPAEQTSPCRTTGKRNVALRHWVERETFKGLEAAANYQLVWKHFSVSTNATQVYIS